MDLKEIATDKNWITSPLKGNPLKRRIFSFFTDLFCVLLISRLLMVSYTSYLKTFMFLMSGKSQHLVQSQLHKIEFSLITVVFFGYFFLSYYMAAGRSPGKMLFRLRVIPNSHERSLLSLKESFTRAASYLFCYLTGFILFAIPYLRKDQSGLADIFSKSKIITEEDFYSLLSQNNTTEEVQLELDFNKIVISESNLIYLPDIEILQSSNDQDKAA